MGACHYPSRTNLHPSADPGAVTGGMRAGPRLSPRRRSNARRASRRSRACARGPRGSRAGALSAPSAGSVAAPAERQAGLGPHSRSRPHGPRSASLRAQRPFVPPAGTAPGASSGSAARRRPPESRRQSPHQRRRAAHRAVDGTRYRVGLGGCVGRSGRTLRARAVRRAPRGGAAPGAVRTASHGVFRRVRNSGTNAEGWHGDSGRARAPDSPSETWEMVMTGRLHRVWTDVTTAVRGVGPAPGAMSRWGLTSTTECPESIIKPGRRVAGSPGRRVAGSPGRPICVCIMGPLSPSSLPA